MKRVKISTASHAKAKSLAAAKGDTLEYWIENAIWCQVKQEETNHQKPSTKKGAKS